MQPEHAWDIFISTPHVHVHDACPCPRYMPIFMLHFYVHAACPSMLLVHVPAAWNRHAAWTGTYSTDMDTQQEHTDTRVDIFN